MSNLNPSPYEDDVSYAGFVNNETPDPNTFFRDKPSYKYNMQILF